MIIYKIKNKITYDLYIGQTIYSLQERWSSHCRNKKNGCRKLRHAIQKYGPENFEISVIARSVGKNDSGNIKKATKTGKIAYGYHWRYI
jgi:group I intron endonuclease